MKQRILCLPGDGIGPEVMRETRRILDWFAEHAHLDLAVEEGLIGGASIDACGLPLSEETLEKAQNAQAILLGAVGGPQWDIIPFERKPERGLLGIRKALGLFANLRPATVFPALASASTLKTPVVSGLDIMIVRELTGGIYFGEPRGIHDLGNGHRRGVNTLVYETGEIERIARVAFDLAAQRQNRLCSVDKANVLEATLLWREEVTRIHGDYPQVALSHMYVDNAAMQLVRDPRQFDVIVTTNMFGDILSDAAAMLTGSLGMLPSASLGAARPDGQRPGLYEPVHGSAPDIAGQGKANPLAMILSLAMALRYSLDNPQAAQTLEDAVGRALEGGARTADTARNGQPALSTRQITTRILDELTKTAPG